MQVRSAFFSPVVPDDQDGPDVAAADVAKTGAARDDIAKQVVVVPRHCKRGDAARAQPDNAVPRGVLR